MSVYQWSTGPGTRIEPDAGEKVSGFVPSTPAAAKKLNDILYELTTFAIDYQTKFAVQHDPATGFHTNITATDLVVTGGDFRVDASGNVIAESLDINGNLSISNTGAVTTTAGVIAGSGVYSGSFVAAVGDSSGANFVFNNDIKVSKRYFIRQESAFGAGGLGGSVSVNANGVQIITLNPTENCRLLFEIPESADLDSFSLHFDSGGGSSDIDWHLYRLALDEADWLEVTGGPVSGSASGVGDIITVNFPDTNSPNEAGHGVKIATTQNLLCLQIVNTNGVNDLTIHAFTIYWYVNDASHGFNQ